MSYSGLGASTDPGTSDVEDIVCPAGYQVSVDSKGNPTCDNGTGGTIPPAFRPSTKLAPMDLIGWSIVGAFGMLLVASFMRKR